jgi:nucleoside-diphosphate-sugar epimerase
VLKALVIGGTGPTGPHIINGLVERGYSVTMLNRGSREPLGVTAKVDRIIGDPHFPDTLEDALSGRTFDLVVATYGRIRYVAEVVSTKTERLITVGGPPSYRGCMDPNAVFPVGMAVPTNEDAQRVESGAESKFGHLIRITEDAVIGLGERGLMNVTHFRYPQVYGPGQIRPTTLWWTMQRCLDQRPFVVMPDGGLSLSTRGFAQNMAHAILLAVDNPEASAGQIYNCGDDVQFTVAQWVGLIAQEMDWRFEFLNVPDKYANMSRDLMLFRGSSHHQVLGLSKAQSQLGYTDQVSPRHAIAASVRWFLDNPPSDEAFIAELRAQYAQEDELEPHYRSFCSALEKLNHETEPYHHSYAHPRQRGLVRDHRDR